MNEIIKALEELILAADIETNMSYRVVIEALTRARAALKAARPTGESEADYLADGQDRRDKRLATQPEGYDELLDCE